MIDVLNRPESLAVPLASGIDLHVVRQGPSTGRVVVLLHGLTDSSFSFSLVMPLLPANLRIVAPDLRGHGDSHRPAAGYSMDDMAHDVVELLDVLDVPRAVVVGHSMGTFVARRVAALARERVDGLVLIGAGRTVRLDHLLEFQNTLEDMADPPESVFVRGFQENTINQPVPPAFMSRVIEDSRKVPARVWRAAFAGMLAYRTPDPALRCPALVVGGDQDSIFSAAEQEAAARELPNATLEIVPGIGHALHWETPGRAAAAIARMALVPG